MGPILSLDPTVRGWRQEVVKDWIVRCFGQRVLDSPVERVARLLEETLEAAQALDLPIEKAKHLVDYVYLRPKGELFQEIGGVSVTLLGLCASAGISADKAEVAEINRILAKPTEQFRARHAEKDAAGIMVVSQETAPCP